MSISSRWTNFFWIAFTGPMLELLILHAFIFRQYLKKWFYFPICIYCISSAANLNILERAYSFITNNNTINVTLICVRGGNFIPLCCFSLNNSEMVKKSYPVILQPLVTFQYWHSCRVWYPWLAPVSRYLEKFRQ